MVAAVVLAVVVEEEFERRFAVVVSLAYSVHVVEMVEVLVASLSVLVDSMMAKVEVVCFVDVSVTV